jgi:hypothetical protein
MDWLNSLLIGFYTLLSYSYSQRHTHITLGSWERDVGHTEKQKRKKILFLFSEPKCFLSDGLFCKYTRTDTYFVFVLSATEGRDIRHFNSVGLVKSDLWGGLLDTTLIYVMWAKQITQWHTLINRQLFLHLQYLIHCQTYRLWGSVSTNCWWVPSIDNLLLITPSW